MTDKPPPGVRYFEGLNLASITIGVVHGIAVMDEGVVGLIFSAAILFGLTLLVSRRRKNWARWVIAASFLFGVVVIVFNFQAGLSVGYPAITLFVSLLQALAIALMFTRESSDWLRKRPPLADTFS